MDRPGQDERERRLEAWRTGEVARLTIIEGESLLDRAHQIASRIVERFRSLTGSDLPHDGREGSPSDAG